MDSPVEGNEKSQQPQHNPAGTARGVEHEPAPRNGEVQKLRRVLSLRDLIFYGIIAVTPSAPATVFGLAETKSHGHAVVTILAAMAAMVPTAISYGRMAAEYPSAGSAYAYVSRGIHPYLGFFAGWAMLLDYIFIPLFCVIYGTLSLERALPWMPFPAGALLFAGGITILNLRGIRYTARANDVMLLFMFGVLVSFIALATKYIVARDGMGGLFSIQPLYSRATFSMRDIASATSFAALTYLGFDAVTTLAEDVKNPRRNVLLATVVVCMFTGIFGGLLVYLAHLVWPSYTTYANVETAFIDVTGRVGGRGLFQAMATLLVVANIGAGLTSQVGAARLLFGMGREGVIPRRVFARLHPVRNTPWINILLLGILAFVGAQVMSYELTAELLNFGAFLGFMGVNAAVIWRSWFRPIHPRARNFLLDLVVPALGFLFCAVIWMGLNLAAKVAGSVWLLVGFGVLAAHTRQFRKPVVMSDLSTCE
ncbi:MAG TPA: APC family permease [Alloacidobacterium sp.]|jgi:amino acid transporter|nr:APC family permease [Alloacidobacterium sp.]